MLRSSITRHTCALQPASLLRPVTAATSASSSSSSSYSTLPTPRPRASSPLLSSRAKLPPTPTRPALLIPAAAAKPTVLLTLRRHASSSSSTKDAARDADASAKAAATAAAESAEPLLDWNTFFALRKTRRRWQLAFSVVMSLVGGTSAAVVLGTGVADPLTNEIPLDPVLTLGLVTMGFISLGWLVGPTLGNAVFYLVKRQYKAPMTVKESQFFTRIKKNRVDPSNDSTGNPVPDFYGEKISSVAGYRQWLKDQRAYNKKRTTFI